MVKVGEERKRRKGRGDSSVDRTDTRKEKRESGVEVQERAIERDCCRDRDLKPKQMTNRKGNAEVNRKRAKGNEQAERREGK